MTRVLAYLVAAAFCVALGFAGGTLAALFERGTAKDQSRAAPAVTVIPKSAEPVRVVSECRGA